MAIQLNIPTGPKEDIVNAVHQWYKERRISEIDKKLLEISDPQTIAQLEQLKQDIQNETVIKFLADVIRLGVFQLKRSARRAELNIEAKQLIQDGMNALTEELSGL